MSPHAENPFWQFSLEIYRQPGVAQACLSLQDRHRLDVNLLLYCCWASSRGHKPGRIEMARLTEAVGAWQDEVVVPLRRARRYLKSCTGKAAESLRQEIKILELEAERQEQQKLFQGSNVPAGEANPTAAVQNLLTCLDCRDLTPSQHDLAELAVLVSAGFGLTRSAAERLLTDG